MIDTRKIFVALFNGPKELDVARQVVEVTVWLSVLIALLAAGFAVADLLSYSSNEEIKYFLGPWIFIDIFLTLLFAFYLHREKLWAPICMILHQFLDWGVIYIEFEEYPTGIGIIKLIIFMSAYRAVQVLNRDLTS